MRDILKRHGERPYCQRDNAAGGWIPAFAGMTGWRGNDEFGARLLSDTLSHRQSNGGLDSRLRGNDGMAGSDRG